MGRGSTTMAATLRLPTTLEVVNSCIDALDFRVTVNNPLDEPICVLPWYSPLEGLRSNCLTCIGPDGELNYRGILARRGAPQASDWVEIAARGSLSKEFSIRHPAVLIYEVELGKTYTISLSREIRVHVGPITTLKGDNAEDGEREEQGMAVLDCEPAVLTPCNE